MTRRKRRVTRAEILRNPARLQLTANDGATLEIRIKDVRRLWDGFLPSDFPGRDYDEVSAEVSELAQLADRADTAPAKTPEKVTAVIITECAPPPEITPPSDKSDNPDTDPIPDVEDDEPTMFPVPAPDIPTNDAPSVPARRRRRAPTMFQRDLFA